MCRDSSVSQCAWDSSSSTPNSCSVGSYSCNRSVNSYVFLGGFPPFSQDFPDMSMPVLLASCTPGPRHNALPINREGRGADETHVAAAHASCGRQSRVSRTVGKVACGSPWL